MQENYCKVLNIEALTMIDMARKDILPAVSSYAASLADAVLSKTEIGVDASYEKELAQSISAQTASMYQKVKALEDALIHTKDYSDSAELSMYYKDSVFAAMSALRAAADQLETLTASDYWPYPSYGELLFGVR